MIITSFTVINHSAGKSYEQITYIIHIKPKSEPNITKNLFDFSEIVRLWIDHCRRTYYYCYKPPTVSQIHAVLAVGWLINRNLLDMEIRWSCILLSRFYHILSSNTKIKRKIYMISVLTFNQWMKVNDNSSCITFISD